MGVEIKKKGGKTFIYIDGEKSGEMIPEKQTDGTKLAGLVDSIEKKGVLKKARTKKVDYYLDTITTNDYGTEIHFNLRPAATLKYRLTDYSMWFDDQPATRTGISKIKTSHRDMLSHVKGPLWLRVFIANLAETSFGRIEKLGSVLLELTPQRTFFYELLAKANVIFASWGGHVGGYSDFYNSGHLNIDLTKKSNSLASVLNMTTAEVNSLLKDRLLSSDTTRFIRQLTSKKREMSRAVESGSVLLAEERSKEAKFYEWAILNKVDNIVIQKREVRVTDTNFPELKDKIGYSCNDNLIQTMNSVSGRINFDNETMWNYLSVDLMRQGYDLLHTTYEASVYKDYLDFCRNLNIDKDKYPMNLATQHHIMYKNNQEIQNREFQRDFRERVDDFRKFEWRSPDHDYIIRIPEKPEDLAKEGAQLSHCVGSYTSRIIAGNCIILFIRHKNEPDESLVTIALDKDYKVGQKSGKNNSTPERPVLEFINAFANKKIPNIKKKEALEAAEEERIEEVKKRAKLEEIAL